MAIQALLRKIRQDQIEYSGRSFLAIRARSRPDDCPPTVPADGAGKLVSGYFRNHRLPASMQLPSCWTDWHAPPAWKAQFSNRSEHVPNRGRGCATAQPMVAVDGSGGLRVAGTAGRSTFGCFEQHRQDSIRRCSYQGADHGGRDGLSDHHSQWRTFHDCRVVCRVGAVVDGGQGHLCDLDRDFAVPPSMADIAEEYGDMTLPRDPFPFTGGLDQPVDGDMDGRAVVTWHARARREPAGLRDPFRHRVFIELARAMRHGHYVGIAVALAAESIALQRWGKGLRQPDDLPSILCVWRHLQGIGGQLFGDPAAEWRRAFLTAECAPRVPRRDGVRRLEPKSPDRLVIKRVLA